MVTAQLPLPMVCTLLLISPFSLSAQQSKAQFVSRVSLNELEDLRPTHSSDPT